MKNPYHPIPAIIGIFACVILLISLLASTPKESIRWRWHDIPVIGDPEHKGERLQFGLRSDGVVVWREILNSTNSPAEKEEAINWSYSLTNSGTNYTWNTVPWELLPEWSKTHTNWQELFKP